MFELKKIFSSLLMPLPALLIIGFVGLMLIMFTAKRKTGCLVVLFSLTGLFLVSFQPVATRLLMPLERTYTAFLPVEGTLDYVMVLGMAMSLMMIFPPPPSLLVLRSCA
ncbi:hypothetical protein VCSRO119_2093 [Vibrio cholerae]|nr:hypothetical protein VCSRO119_2093 [Vibrio cholerae]